MIENYLTSNRRKIAFILIDVNPIIYTEISIYTLRMDFISKILINIIKTYLVLI